MPARAPPRDVRARARAPPAEEAADPPGSGRRARRSRPSGPSSWADPSGSLDAMSAHPQITGVHHIGITVTDLDTSAAWYTRVLGARELRRLDIGPMTKALVRLGPVTLGLVSHGRTAAPGPFDEHRAGLDHLSLAVPDMAGLRAWRLGSRARAWRTAASSTAPPAHSSPSATRTTSRWSSTRRPDGPGRSGPAGSPMRPADSPARGADSPVRRASTGASAPGPRPAPAGTPFPWSAVPCRHAQSRKPSGGAGAAREPLGGSDPAGAIIPRYKP